MKILWLWILFILGANAAIAGDIKIKFPPLSWDQQVVNQIASAARQESLPKAKLKDGSVVGQETAIEKERPLIPEAFAKKVVDHAVFWYTVNWCGLSLEKADFSELQDESKWNGKQRAFIAVLYGTTTGLVQEQLGRLESCSKEFRDYITKNHPETAN